MTQKTPLPELAIYFNCCSQVEAWEEQQQLCALLKANLVRVKKHCNGDKSTHKPRCWTQQFKYLLLYLQIQSLEKAAVNNPHKSKTYLLTRGRKQFVWWKLRARTVWCAARNSKGWQCIAEKHLRSHSSARTAMWPGWHIQIRHEVCNWPQHLLPSSK